MNFSVDVKEFSNTLKLITSVLPNVGTAFTSTFVIAKDAFWIYASNELVTLKCKAKGISAIEGKGIAGVDLTLLDNLLKGRTHASFENKGTVFQFKVAKSAYKGDVSIIPVVKETIEGYDELLTKNKKSKLSVLDPETFSALRTALALSNISVIHSSDVLDTYVLLKDKQLEVVSSDNFHLAYCKIPVTSDSTFQLSPTKTIFDTLGKLSDFYGGNTQIEFSQESIKAFNENYAISTPTIQSSDTAFLRTKAFISDLPKAVCSFNLKVSATSSALENILSIYEDGALIIIELKSTKKGDVLEFSMKSTMGTITDHIKVEDLKGKPFKCQFDPRMLRDSLNISKCSEVNFSYIADKAIVLKSAKDKAKTVYVNSVVSE